MFDKSQGCYNHHALLAIDKQNANVTMKGTSEDLELTEVGQYIKGSLNDPGTDQEFRVQC